MHSFPVFIVLLLTAVSCPPAFSVDSDSGSNSYARWENGPPADPGFFPIGVWLQNPRLAKRYQNMGINLYVGLWEGPTKEQLSHLKIAKMPVICVQNELGLRYKDEKTIVGWLHAEEPDNAQPRGKFLPHGPPIAPEKVIADYADLREKDPTRPIFLGLGQGVAWDNWHGRGARTNHPEDYEEYVKGGDIISFDIYPVAHTHKEVSGHLWFVAKGVSRLQEWTKGQKIIWNAIECTGIRSAKKPTPAQVRAEVWMSLIHGSMGIIYFVHSWHPQFNEAALLDDPEMVNSITEINNEIHSLASVLNSPTVKDDAEVNSTNPGVPIAVLVKKHRESTYVFAVAMRNGPTTGVFSMSGFSGPGTVKVLGEDRTLPMENGRFEDEFETYGVHLYQVNHPTNP